MDYRDLLKKYMNYVGACEGITFVLWGDHPNCWNGSKEEWAELEAIDEELERESEEIKP